MTIRLDGKSIVITGAGRGLGQAYARACADAGAAVVVNDVDAGAVEDTADGIRRGGGTAVAVVGSVSSWTDAEHMIDVCVSEYGRVDGLVANAAIMYMVAPWEESEERLRAIVDVNVLGVQFSATHAMRAMKATGGGSIVTVTSGAQFGMRGMSAYGTTKGAVNAMTLNWALEGAEHGIRVNAVSPFARTTMTLDHTTEDPMSYPLPEAIAPAVVALLCDTTADVTGRLVRFDGERLSAYETVRAAVGERQEWTAEDIATALAAR